MNSRVENNYERDSLLGTRSQRNEALYKEISKTELEGFEVKPNEEIIGKSNDIDVDKIKSILDTHYNDAPKRKSIRLEQEESYLDETPLNSETKEYDINVILDRAKEEKEDIYSEDRAKKLRDTQFDILNNLDLKDYIEDYDDDSKQEKEDLKKLIDTVTLHEKTIHEIKEESTDSNPLDIFEDLKGSGNTEVLDAIQDDDSDQEEEETTTDLDKSFFTNNEKFNQKDFEDFSDVEGAKTSGIVKFIIILLVIIFIAGCGILVKTLLF